MREEGRIVAVGYSYADLTIIRMVRALRDDKIDFNSAAVALRHLYDRLGPPSRGWADAHVYFAGNRVFAYQPDEWDTTDATRFGQKIEKRLFGDLFEELRDLEEGASIVVPRQFRKDVEINPRIMGGEPVVRRTRVPTAALAALADKGKSVGEIARLYRPVPRRAIEKAIEYERFLDKRIA
jgi:uncharacterized protein (DUF433 family)